MRVAFRVQLSNPEFEPQQIALPDFLRAKVPLVKIGSLARRGNKEYVEPRYDHPEFRKAFSELNQLLAAEFDGNPLIEWMDLMHISAQIEIRPGVFKPVTWACEQGLNRDGSITVDVKRFDDAAWRKGI